MDNLKICLLLVMLTACTAKQQAVEFVLVDGCYVSIAGLTSAQSIDLVNKVELTGDCDVIIEEETSAIPHSKPEKDK